MAFNRGYKRVNVVFLSACSKKSISRTRRILDGYAIRTSQFSWMTPITEEALTDIWVQLKSSASKNTSVACYRNSGRQKMKLLWIVGNRKMFNEYGHYSTGSIKTNDQFDAASTIIQHLSSAGGLGHDLGKATILFLSKLKGEITCEKGKAIFRDPVRHEWVSAIIVEKVLNGATVAEALQQLTWDLNKLKKWMPFKIKRGITTINDALLFVVSTHHKMLSSNKSGSMNSDVFFKNIDFHKQHNSNFMKDPSKFFKFGSEFPDDLDQKICKTIGKLKEKNIFDIHHLRAISLISRCFLIMADHTISSQRREDKATLYANTINVEKNKGKKPRRVLNQSLEYHLKAVGDQANRYAYFASNTHWDGLPSFTTEKILRPADPESRFHWQNVATESLSKARMISDSPALVINVAGTGSGKTRMNAKAAASLNKRPELRISTALGLRSLTMQTGDAYREELEIEQAHLSCIIGDHVTKELYKSKLDNIIYNNDDEDDPEVVFDAFSSTSLALPDWLNTFSECKPGTKKLLAPPVLVSTIDYLIAAGDPFKQGHHASAMLRLMNSDLILDEIDDYSQKSFVAVLRLVEMAAMLGCNVITSSATLPFPMAKQLVKSFGSGVKMWSKIHNKKEDFITAIISNYFSPHIEIGHDIEAATVAYKERMLKSLPSMKKNCFKKSYIVAIAAPLSQASFLDSCLSGIQTLHNNTSWEFPHTDKRVSFGLLRLTYVKDIHRTAHFLARELPNDYIATYHSDELTIQRSLKEKFLDRILTRKNSNENIINDPYINELIAKSPAKDCKFILISSPAEEVGRDHDFDWSLIEPNSARSIVQTAGRVNRHRLTPVTKANIGILDRSFRCCLKNNCSEESHYHKPGFEPTDKPFPSHSMSDLLDLKILDNFSPELRFGESQLAKLEDQSIENVINSPVDKLTLNNPKFHDFWMSEYPYKKYPLRENSQQKTFSLVDDEFKEYSSDEFGRRVLVDSKDHFVRTSDQDPNNTWLHWPMEKLVAFTQSRKIAPHLSFQFSLNLAKNSDGPRTIKWSQAFGFDKSQK